MKRIGWQYTKDPNDFNEWLEEGEGDITENIISITYDSNHGCYVVFFWEEVE